VFYYWQRIFSSKDRLTNTASSSLAIVPQKLIFGQQVKKLADFCGSHRFIILFTKICFWTLTSPMSVQSPFSHFVYLKSIVILFPPFTSRSSKWPIPSWFLHTMLPVFLIFYMRPAWSADPRVCHSNSFRLRIKIMSILNVKVLVLLLRICLVQIFLLAFCSQTPFIFLFR
jgi:hypothetical protein